MSEVKIADFFLEKGFEIELFDHFTPLRIDKLNWGYLTGLVDSHETSLLELVESIDSVQCTSQHHLGFSLGGYIGLNNAHLFKTVFCCYPGILPIIKSHFTENVDKIHIFEGSEDMWTRFPSELRPLIHGDHFHIIDGAYHSFMSFDKDKECPVYSYQFNELFADRPTLSQIQLNHSSISKFGSFKKIVSRNKTHKDGIRTVLNKILKEIDKNER